VVAKTDVLCSPYSYGHEGIDDNVEFDEDRDGSDDDKEIDVDEI
jgi:translation initiation factor 1A